VNNKLSRKGFSLIEVLVFISILSFVFITAIALGIVSIRNSLNTENKILAARYGEELLAWLRSQKDADWLTFVNKTTSPPGVAYCFDQEPVDTWPTSGSCTDEQLVKALFKRQATLSYDSSTQRINVDIAVDWKEGNNKYSLPIKGVFSQLE
jgi:type II secretory pathway pseudopilin PulG